MPRANRHYVPGQVWHITHRCHDRSFLLRFARDRRCYLDWLREARERFGLCILNYVITSNHVHLLIKDGGERALARSMQLAAGRTAHQYNRRKRREGAFWDDRYHATAVEANEQLHRCLVYIDLNMVRARAVQHPGDWMHGGYCEIHGVGESCGLIDLEELSRLSGFARTQEFREAHREWIAQALAGDAVQRDARWSEAVAVGGQAFVEGVKRALGIGGRHRGVEQTDGTWVLRESMQSYTISFSMENASAQA